MLPRFLLSLFFCFLFKINCVDEEEISLEETFNLQEDNKRTKLLTEGHVYDEDRKSRINLFLIKRSHKSLLERVHTKLNTLIDNVISIRNNFENIHSELSEEEKKNPDYSMKEVLKNLQVMIKELNEFKLMIIHHNKSIDKFLKDELFETHDYVKRFPLERISHKLTIVANETSLITEKLKLVKFHQLSVQISTNAVTLLQKELDELNEENLKIFESINHLNAYKPYTVNYADLIAKKETSIPFQKIEENSKKSRNASNGAAGET